MSLRGWGYQRCGSTSPQRRRSDYRLPWDERLAFIYPSVHPFVILEVYLSRGYRRGGRTRWDVISQFRCDGPISYANRYELNQFVIHSVTVQACVFLVELLDRVLCNIIGEGGSQLVRIPGIITPSPYKSVLSVGIPRESDHRCRRDGRS